MAKKKSFGKHVSTITPVLIGDIRKNLNEAQDYGQESMVWAKRAIKLDRADFEFDVYVNARTAFSRAVRFLEFTEAL